MKYIKTFESSLNQEEKEDLLNNTCYYLEEIMPKIKGFEECVYSATDWVDYNIDNDADFTFYFDTMYFDEEEFEDFDEFIINNKLDNDIKERYYDTGSDYNPKRMLSFSIKIKIEKVIEFGELYNSTSKFNI